MTRNLYRRAQFLLGVADLSQLPPDRGSEVAFAGRSNAGKSSALNAIAEHGGLARTSKTPGRTQQINFFTLDDDRRLADLPGYGYARVPEAEKRRWQRLLHAYLEGRRSLKGLVLVMDIRHPFTDFDRHMIEWCREAAMPLHLLLTKADKLNRGPAQSTLLKARGDLERIYPGSGIQLFSSTAKMGLEEARALLDRWLEVAAPAEGQKKAPD